MEGSRMGQVRHGCATTTHAVRAAIQRSQASLATLSRELGINPKTVAKWRKRATVEDLKTGPKAPGLSGILCGRPLSSSDDEPLAEDDGELGLCLRPLAGWTFPLLSGGVEYEV